MTMKKILIIIVGLILFFTSSAQKACPTNVDSDVVKDIDRNLRKWHGKVVAFDAVVTEIQTGYVGKPFYKVKLGSEFLWIGGHGKGEYLEIGRLRRILGIVSEVGDDEINKKYNPKKYFILSLAFIDMETKQGSVFPEAKSQFDEWTNGKIPVVKK